MRALPKGPGWVWSCSCPQFIPAQYHSKSYSRGYKGTATYGHELTSRPHNLIDGIYPFCNVAQILIINNKINNNL